MATRTLMHFIRQSAHVNILTLAVVLMTVTVGCEDSRMDVYEFIELQKQVDQEQFVDSTRPLLPSRSVVGRGKVNPVAVAASENSGSGGAHSDQCPDAVEKIGASDKTAGSNSRYSAVVVPSAKTVSRTGVVTYAGQWQYNKQTGMWSFAREKGETGPVILAAHRSPSSATNTSDGTPPPPSPPIAPVAPVSPRTRMPTSVEAADNDAGMDDATLHQIYSEFHRPYRVGPGDVLRVSLTGLTGIEMLMEPTEVLARINRQGTITLPLVGAVLVTDLEIEDVERAVYDAYVPKFVSSLGLSIDVSEYGTTDVVVVGAALLPGIVKLNRCQRDVLHAVVLAGGMTQEASGSVILQRIASPREKFELNVRNTHHLKTALALEPLESGDVVNVVAAQPNTIFVGGLVNNPGPKEFPPGTRINALQALAAGGGAVEAVLPTEATLIRRLTNGEDAFVRVDLEKTRSGRDPNIELAAGDIFWVPETLGTRIMDFINRTIFLRAGMTVTYNVTGVEFMNRRNLQGSRTGGNNNLQNSVDPLGFLSP